MITTTMDYQKLQNWRPKHLHFHFRLSVVVTIAHGHFPCAAGRGQKSQICRRNYHPIYHSSRDISISGFGPTLPFPVVGHCRNHLTTLFGLAMVENPAGEAKRSMVRLVSDAIEWQGRKVSRVETVSRRTLVSWYVLFLRSNILVLVLRKMSWSRC